jgi:hypothetical protein
VHIRRRDTSNRENDGATHVISYAIVETGPDGNPVDPWVEFREMLACGDDLWSLRAYGLFARVDLDFAPSGRCRWVGAIVDLAWALSEWLETRPSRMRFHPLEHGDVLEIHIRGELVQVRTARCEVVVAAAAWTAAVADFLARLWSDVCSHEICSGLPWDWMKRL